MIARNNSELLRILTQHGLRWQVQEAVVALALLEDPSLAFEHRLSNWKWAKDQGPGKKAQDCDVPDGFSPARNTSLFVGRYLCTDVRELQEATLYRSAGWQMVACEFILVSHSTRSVFAIQVSERVPKKHAFKAHQIARIKAALQLRADYTLKFVFVIPFQQDMRWPTGMVVEQKDSTHQNIGCGFVVQACITPGDKPIVAHVGSTSQ